MGRAGNAGEGGVSGPLGQAAGPGLSAGDLLLEEQEP